MEIVGVLRNAALIDMGGYECLRGQVYGDTKGRFFDGDWIRTSFVVEKLPERIFRTRNSAYQVETWARTAPSPANDNLTPRAQFDAASPLQEELAINIAAQIGNGVKPDAVQVLEWAAALYEAEVGGAA